MLLICRTCPRYDTRSSGEFSRQLIEAIDEICDREPEVRVQLRKVQCLGGCPADGVIALDGPGKARVRFTGLGDGLARAVVEAARAHEACPSGIPQDWKVPAELDDHLSSVTVKRLAR